MQVKQFYSILFLLFGLVCCWIPSRGQTVTGTINSVAAGVTAISGTTLTVTSSAGFASCDRLVIIQMKGGTVNNVNGAAYGQQTSIGNAGVYEFTTIDQVVDGTTIKLKANLSNSYVAGSGLLQIVKVYVFDNVSVTNKVTAPAWNGVTGGVLVMEGYGTLTLPALKDSISMTGTGYRGGTNSCIIGSSSCSNCLTYVYSAGFTGPYDNTYSGKGEGVTNFNPASNLDVAGMGAHGNGGGGGIRCEAGGGGGGAYGGGGNGGWPNSSTSGCGTYKDCKYGRPAWPLSSYYSISRALMGGGGGAGNLNNNSGGCNLAGPLGRAGGGIIIIKCPTISVGAGNIISANGASNNTNDWAAPRLGGSDGMGGGGGGGTVLLDIGTMAGAGTLNVRAQGGYGGYATYTTSYLGPGGGGGGGYVVTNGITPTTISVVGGVGGTSNRTSDNSFIAHNASAGTAGASATGLVIPGYFPGLMPAGTYTVGGSSPDFPTLSAALAEYRTRGMGGAITFSIRPGTYTVTDVVDLPCGLPPSATRPLVIQAESTPVTLTSANQNTLAISGPSYVTFRNLNIVSTNASPLATTISTGSTNITLDNCQFTGNLVSGANTFVMTTCTVNGDFTNNGTPLTATTCTVNGNVVNNGATMTAPTMIVSGTFTNNGFLTTNTNSVFSGLFTSTVRLTANACQFNGGLTNTSATATAVSATNCTIGNFTHNAGTATLATAATLTGNITIAAGATLSAGIVVTLGGTGNHQWTNNGTMTLLSLIMNKTGDMTLNQNITLPATGVLTMTNGTITTGAFDLILLNKNAAGIVIGAGGTSWVKGNIRKDILLNTNATYNFPLGWTTYNPLTLAFTYAASKPSVPTLRVSYDPAKPVTGTVPSTVEACAAGLPFQSNHYAGFWRVENYTGTGVVGTYDLTAKRAVANASGRWTILSRELPGDPWLMVGACSASSTPTNIIRTGLTSFSEKGAFSTGTPFPVELLAFTGQTEGDHSVQLDWLTATELNNDHFEVEHSLDAQNFTLIGQVKGAGNSQTVSNYQFTHPNANAGVNYYRLKQVDFNGGYKYSNTIEVDLSQELSEYDFSIAPNPVGVNQPMQLRLRGANEQSVAMRFFDLTGRTLWQHETIIPSSDNGYRLYDMPTPRLAAGIYYLHLSSSLGWSGFKRVVIAE